MEPRCKQQDNIKQGATGQRKYYHPPGCLTRTSMEQTRTSPSWESEPEHMAQWSAVTGGVVMPPYPYMPMDARGLSAPLGGRPVKSLQQIHMERSLQQQQQDLNDLHSAFQKAVQDAAKQQQHGRRQQDDESSSGGSMLDPMRLASCGSGSSSDSSSGSTTSQDKSASPLVVPPAMSWEAMAARFPKQGALVKQEGSPQPSGMPLSMAHMSPIPYWPYPQAPGFAAGIPAIPHLAHMYGLPHQQLPPQVGPPFFGMNMNLAGLGIPPGMVSMTGTASPGPGAAAAVAAAAAMNPAYMRGAAPGFFYGASYPQPGLPQGPYSVVPNAYMPPAAAAAAAAAGVGQAQLLADMTEDERRKANQRRRKQESRRRLREADPIGYREKEAKARRDRRLKQRARVGSDGETDSADRPPRSSECVAASSPLRHELPTPASAAAVAADQYQRRQQQHSGASDGGATSAEEGGSGAARARRVSSSAACPPPATAVAADDEDVDETGGRLHLRPQFAEDLRQAKRFKALAAAAKGRRPTSLSASSAGSSGDEDTASGVSDYTATSVESAASSLGGACGSTAQQ
ncbi:hypothetical protein JKP88DRAFT_245431 [Tribonema minus]|uniref:Uncharacterized protein n=1 Tax=Tribonema minus TaxID=303371 RepID=A0A835YZZ5_9STRA|nr:hypothetical protein JKP88DRAFT_245431 [Tribonema minus]